VRRVTELLAHARNKTGPFELTEFPDDILRWCWICPKPYYCIILRKHFPFMHIAGFKTKQLAVIYGAMRGWNEWPPYVEEELETL